MVSQMAGEGASSIYDLDDQYQNPNTNDKDNLVVRLTRGGVVFTNGSLIQWDTVGALYSGSLSSGHEWLARGIICMI